MRRLLSVPVLLLLTVGLSVPSQAQPTGFTAFSFLQVEPSARAASLGGAFSAMYGDDVNGLFYNPALLNEQTHRQLSLSYLNHLSDVNMGFVAYGHHVEALGTTVGGGLRFLGWGDLEGADALGNRTGSFRASDLALTLTGARAYTDQLRYGASVHLIRSAIDDVQAVAVAADLGVVYLVPAQALTLSASVHNLGVTLSNLGETDDVLPVDVRVSVTKRLQNLPLRLSVLGYDLTDPGSDLPEATAADNVLNHVAVGGEFLFSEAFQVRLGYNHRRHEALATKSRLDLAGLGIGFGLRLARVRVDYGYNSWSSLGGLHQFTLGTTI
ncbi:MAG: type IX secretion system protein PorQ [Bacteroidota bacterium]